MYKISKYIWLRYNLENASLVLWLMAVLFYCFHLVNVQNSRHLSLRSIKKKDLNYEQIGQGPFSLNPHYLNPVTPKVLESLYVVKGSSLKFGENFIHIATSDLDDLHLLPFHKITSLKTAFSKDVEHVLQEWSIKPLFIDKDSLVAEAYHKDHDTLKIVLPLKEKASLNTQAGSFQDTAYLTLNEAQYLGPDLLTVDEKKSHRVKMADGRIFALKNLDVISFINSQWENVDSLLASKAQLFCQDHEIYFLVVDESGFLESKICLKQLQAENFNPELYMPQGVKVYPNQQFSCFIGRQKFILKKHDWILRSDNFFHILKSKADIESLVNFKKYGPLIVIDEVTDRKQTSLIRGKIFSPLRMKVHLFEIEAPVINPEKTIKNVRVRGRKATT
jgi:hypothetical protein